MRFDVPLDVRIGQVSFVSVWVFRLSFFFSWYLCHLFPIFRSLFVRSMFPSMSRRSGHESLVPPSGRLSHGGVRVLLLFVDLLVLGFWVRICLVIV